MSARRAIERRICAAFSGACEEHGLHGRLEPVHGGRGLRAVFDGQENAAGAQIAAAFFEEMRDVGVDAEPALNCDATMDAMRVETICRAIRQACGRLRSLLVSHNSYVQSGFPCVFRAAGTTLQEGGLSVTRFPADASCRVGFTQGCVTIDFEPGDLGDITSSGFYCPTPVHGDYRVDACYRVREWLPGAETACFGLFTMHEDQQQRYYVQRMSAGASSPTVIAHLAGLPGPPMPSDALEGQWRIERRQRVVSAWHRTRGPWTLLGEHTEAEAAAVVVGAKIWGGSVCRGLRGDVLDLEVEGEARAIDPAGG